MLAQDLEGFDTRSEASSTDDSDSSLSDVSGGHSGKVQSSFRTLKTLDSFGNCQGPVFSLGASQHTCMHKITNL